MSLSSSDRSVIPRFPYYSIPYFSIRAYEERRNKQRHKRRIESSYIMEVATTNACNVLLLLHCLVPYKKTVLRLWLEQTERRTESEGKEWVLMFPEGVKAENERGDMEHAGVGSTPGQQPGSPLFKLNGNSPNMKYRECSHVHAYHDECAHSGTSSLSNGKKSMLPKREKWVVRSWRPHLKHYTTS